MTSVVQQLHMLTTEAYRIADSLSAGLHRGSLTESERKAFGRDLSRIRDDYSGMEPFIYQIENSSFYPGCLSSDIHYFNTALRHAENLLSARLPKSAPPQEASVAEPALPEAVEPSEIPVQPSAPTPAEPSHASEPVDENPAPKGLLIDMFVSPERAPDMVFNLQQAFEERWTKVHGLHVARMIFLTQSIGVILSFWTAWLLKRARLLGFLRPS